MTITFTIDHVPVAKGRARSTRSGHHYTPQKTRDFEALVRDVVKWECADRNILEPSLDPIAIEINFMFKIPKSWPKKKADNAKLHTSKPDLDNLEKAICDAMNGIVYKDDSQICMKQTKKVWGEKDEITVKIGPPYWYAW